jgi:hypothetical protein
MCVDVRVTHPSGSVLLALIRSSMVAQEVDDLAAYVG